MPGRAGNGSMRSDLTRRLSDDLDGAFEELVHAHLDLVYGMALRMTGNGHDAEEITQDAFEHAYRAMRRYPSERIRALRLRPWLARIALNAARTRLRRKSHPTRALVDADELWLTADNSSDGAWAGLVAALPPRYRAAVVLRYVEDLSYEDAAEALGLPVGTVKTHVHRAIRLLRDALEKETR